MGASVGEGNYLPLIALIGFGAFLFFISGGSRFTFHALVFFVLLGGSFLVGFRVSPTEQFLLLSAMLFVISWWRQPPPLSFPAEIPVGSFRFVQTMLLVWTIFVLLHGLLHITVYDEGLKNIAKSYIATSAPYFILLFFSIRPTTLKLPKDYAKIFVLILFIVLVFSVGIRAYQTFFGSTATSLNPGETDMAEAFTLPMIRFEESVYALRAIAPISMLWGILILTSKQAGFQSLFWRFLGLQITFIATLGSLFSGGRASLVLGLAFITIALFLRKQRASLFVGICAAALIIVTANVFSDFVNYRAPAQISRTLQWVLLEKNEAVAAAIEGSSSWRLELARKAIEEWRSDFKTMIIGWGFRGISDSDMAVAGIAGASYSRVDDDFAHYISIKRVATHNLFTDLLVAFGVIGAIFYYTLLLSFMVFTAKVYARMSPTSPHKDFTLATMSLVWGSAIVANFAGSFLSPVVLLYLLILICALFQQREAPLPVEEPFAKRLQTSNRF
jgi:hypothetical protein